MNMSRHDDGGRTRVAPPVGPGRRQAGMAAFGKPKNAGKTISRLWGYIGRRGAVIFFVFLLVIASSLAALFGSYLIKPAIDDYIVPGNFSGLWSVLAAMIALHIIGAGATWLQNILMIRATQETVFEMRRDLFAKIQRLPLSFFDSRSDGEMMSRFTNDIDNVSNALNLSVTQLFSSVITIIGTIILMFVISPILAVITILTVPLIIFTTGKITKTTRKSFRAQQKSLGFLNGRIEEIISGQKVVKVFSKEEKMLADFDGANRDFQKKAIKAQFLSGIIMPILGGFNSIGYALTAGFGGVLVLRGALGLGNVAAFLQYSRQFSRPLNEIANQFNLIQAALAGAERMFEIMDEAQEVPDKEGAAALSNVSGRLLFENVNFSYVPGKPVLKDFNLAAKKGEKIALVGPTGAGKTTVVNLLTRFYEIDSGSIKIDDKNILDITKESLRRSLAIVLQDTRLFSETVCENIRYGRPEAGYDEVVAAAKTANAHEFIKRLPKGYDTLLSEDGGNLSQGQRQLLSIARAILANPPILILDEATSSVDTRTEQSIQRAMFALMKGRTSFVIAHRLSTIKNADQILVIDGGRVIESGSHSELMAQNGMYQKLYTGLLELR